MANTARLADALERAEKAARREVVQSASLRRSDRELLLRRGYLHEICKGWYLLSRPTQRDGESTLWYAAFWDFLAVYLQKRFGSGYCLSAVPSLEVHIGSNLVPRQLPRALAKHCWNCLKRPRSWFTRTPGISRAGWRWSRICV